MRATIAAAAMAAVLTFGTGSVASAQTPGPAPAATPTTIV